MKMMEVSSVDNDCVEDVTPAKRKKMKQASLPFQMSNTQETPKKTRSTKKRKLTSPAIDYKSPKVMKHVPEDEIVEGVEILEKNVTEDNVLNKSGDSIEIIEIHDAKTEQKKKEDSKEVKNDKPTRRSRGKGRKSDVKTQASPGILIKFLQKTDKENETKLNVNDNTLAEKSSSQKDDDDEEEEKSSQKEKNRAQVQNSSKEKRTEDESEENDVNETLSTENGDIEEIKNEEIEQLDVSKNVDSDADVINVSEDDSDKAEKTENKEDANDSKNMGTPKTNKSLRESKQKKLTPKQLEKRKELDKRREEKQKLKMEKEKKREEEREIRKREKEEKRKEREEKEKAEKEFKRKEKELKEMKKQMEIEQKQKEKEAKEEERRRREEAKEEERKRKEEEKLEAERKKQKAASNFASFFVAKKQEVKSVEEEKSSVTRNFMPFEVKADMRMAPVHRRHLDDSEKSELNDKLNKDLEKSDLYIEDIRNKRIIPRSSEKTWPLGAKDDDIVILDEENEGSSNIEEKTPAANYRPKLLQFAENRRPPYWGTWRKSSSFVTPRKPFSQDTKWFDYEVDSDEEWEEEEPGESLRGSDDEKDDENPEENEYDVDNEFMVPHGYLSDEEARAGGEEKEDMSPETQKFKLKVLGEEFEAERNTKTSKLRPKIIGCVWEDVNNKLPENISKGVAEFLSTRKAWVNQIPVVLPTPSESTAGGSDASMLQPTSTRKTKVPVEAIPDLIRLIHGNTNGRGFLVKEFMTFWNKKTKTSEHSISKSSLLKKIKEIARRMACPEEGPMHLKACWYVSEEIRKEYLPDETLSIPNSWKYNLTPKRKSDAANIVEKLDKEEDKEKEKEKERKSVPLITQYTKKISQDEIKKQLTTKSSQSVPAKPILQRPPKRATLISVGKNEQFPKPRTSLLSKFISNDKKTIEPTSVVDDTDEIMIVNDSEDDKAKSQKIAVEENEKSVENLPKYDNTNDKQQVSTETMDIDIPADVKKDESAKDS